MYYRATSTHGGVGHEQNVCQSVCLSVRLSVKRVTERKKLVPTLFYHMKERYNFPTRRMVGGGRPLVPEIWGQTDPAQAKTPIFNRYSLVVPQP